MKKVENKQFKIELLLWLSLEVLFIISMFIFIINSAFLLSLLLFICCICILIRIVIKTNKYIKYIKCDKILEGKIINVKSFRCYTIQIQHNSKIYLAKYGFLSSRIKDKIGCKCSFVLLDNGKVCIKDIE